MLYALAVTNEDDDGERQSDVERLRYQRLGRFYLADEPRKECWNVVLTSADYHKETKILVVGFSNGSFFIYSLPEVTLIHSLRFV